MGEDSGLIYNLYLFKFLALATIQLTASHLLLCITSTLTSFGLLLHLFVRRGTRQSGYLKYPEHTLLASIFELFSLSLSLSLCFTSPSQNVNPHPFAFFFMITPIITFLVIFTSVFNSFRVYAHRIALKAYSEDEGE